MVTTYTSQPWRVGKPAINPLPWRMELPSANIIIISPCGVAANSLFLLTYVCFYTTAKLFSSKAFVFSVHSSGSLKPSKI